jgi:hypothetical protein
MDYLVFDVSIELACHEATCPASILDSRAGQSHCAAMVLPNAADELVSSSMTSLLNGQSERFGGIR